jgi:hypothetical protein
MPIKFLQEKILDLQSALFVPDINSELTLPTHVVTSAVADEEGNIWFVIPRPSQHIESFQKEFPAKLDFFKKGKGFYLKIQGKAFIVEEAKDASHCISDEANKRIEEKKAVAIKVQIQMADYFENIPKQSNNWIMNGGSHLINWLMNPKYDARNPQLVCIPVMGE